MVLYEMCTDRYPFNSPKDFILANMIPLSPDVNPTIQKMITMTLNTEKEKRPSARELLAIIDNEYVNQQTHEEIITRGISFTLEEITYRRVEYGVNEEKKMLVLKGKGEMNDYSPDGGDAKWFRFNESIQSLFILKS